MQTQNLIQTTANVIQITNLKIGDVFKVIDADGYGGPTVKYGVVNDLMNDGEKTYIEVVEYEKSYGSVDAKIKLYTGTKDISLFPATVEEVKEHFDSVLASIGKDIEKDEKALQNKIEAHERATEFVSGETTKQLTEATFVELSQGEFDAQKKLSAPVAE